MKNLITKLSSRRICWLTGCFVLGVAKFSWASVLSRDTPEKRKWDHNDLVLGKGVRTVIDISILPSKHSIVGPLSFSRLLNSFVAMACIFHEQQYFSIILELMKHVDTEFLFCFGFFWILSQTINLFSGHGTVGLRNHFWLSKLFAQMFPPYLARSTGEDSFHLYALYVQSL